MMRRSTLPCAENVTEISLNKVKMNVVYATPTNNNNNAL